MILRAFAFTLFVTGLVASGLPAEDKSQPVPPDHVERVKKGTALFKSHVREILEKACLECHGGKSLKGDFDLSSREKLMESGFVGKTAAESQLVKLITHSEEPHMPLKAPKLPDATINHIKQWIDLGAPYDKPLVDKPVKAKGPLEVSDKDREFWSFRRLQQPTVPAVKNEAWCRTPIDRFIAAKHEAAGLKPNGIAAKRSLLRRAYFDLIGLPPSPEDVDAFVNSTDPDAWPKLIDKLLESPQYGERWARHWLDIARFAESHGYEQDYDRPTAYHYRDFLIKALNQDMPYDQFVQWQLAGDELAPDNPLAMMATGFLGAGAFPTQLTEAEFESARYDELDDMVTTTGVGILGLSLGCARCHDHKFDPVPAKDYYNLMASFTTAIRSEVTLDLDPVGNKKRQEAFDAQVAELATQVSDFKEDKLPGKLREWLKTYDPTAAQLGAWEQPKVVSVTGSAKTKYVEQPDGSWLATGGAPNKETITVVLETINSDVKSLRLEALAHDSLPSKGPGRAPNGNFVVSNITVEATALNSPTGTKPVNVPLTNARATHQQNTNSLSVASSLDDDHAQSGWAVDMGGIGKDNAAVFDAQTPIAFDGGARLTVTIVCNHSNPKHALGRFRLSLTGRSNAQPEVGNSGPEAAVVAALAAMKAKPDEAAPQWKIAIDWFAKLDKEWSALNDMLQMLKAKGPQLAMSKVLVTSEGLPHLPHHADGRGFPHFYPKTFQLKRGDVNQKGDEAQQGFLQVLMPATAKTDDWKISAPNDSSRTSFRRATLSKWITDVKDGAGPLAARVMVNRLWQHHFGRGIVASPNDFGLKGDNPTHPELLEWLANDLVANGWKLKRLHKLIMLSMVYQQSGDFDEGRAKIDRENQLIWRRAPRRLEAEAIRDSMLAVSGQLDGTMFGPGTLDQNMKRRSVYFFIKRSGLIPMMMLFDWPEHLVSIGQRGTTTIAPQALMFMNSPQGRVYADAFAKRLTTTSNEDAARTVFRLAFGRQPSAKEQAASIAFLTQQEAKYKADGRQDGSQLARVDLCQAIMGMNEFVYVD